MSDVENMTSDERVRWVLTTPRSERPGRGPLEALTVREMAKLAAKSSLSKELSDEVVYGFLTAEEAMEIQIGRDEATSEEGTIRCVIKGPPRARRSPKPPAEEAQRTIKPPSIKQTQRETKSKSKRLAKSRPAGQEPILHVVSGFDELKVYPGYLEWGSRWMKMGRFNTLPFSRIQKIERRRPEYSLISRHLYIETTDGTSIELMSIDKENAELVTRTIYRAMGGDYTKAGKIDLA